MLVMMIALMVNESAWDETHSNLSILIIMMQFNERQFPEPSPSLIKEPPDDPENPTFRCESLTRQNTEHKNGSVSPLPSVLISTNL
jgi:hypothetical protein